MSDPNSSKTPDVADWLTRARRIFYGTATALVEIIQDPDKRSENLNKLSLDLNQLADELAIKGEITEQEALRFIEQINQQNTADSSSAPPDDASSPVSPPPPAPPPAPEGSPTPQVSSDEISELMELTRQIESLRMDLERLRTQDPPADPPS
ncbi:MAG: hypothetical protein NW237_09440 [Cyanobacteriota bacterium]|nr:hypothetical protein [Cyanobacteriota bacterium]